MVGDLSTPTVVRFVRPLENAKAFFIELLVHHSGWRWSTWLLFLRRVALPSVMPHYSAGFPTNQLNLAGQASFFSKNLKPFSV